MHGSGVSIRTPPAERALHLSVAELLAVLGGTQVHVAIERLWNIAENREYKTAPARITKEALLDTRVEMYQRHQPVEVHDKPGWHAARYMRREGLKHVVIMEGRSVEDAFNPDAIKPMPGSAILLDLGAVLPVRIVEELESKSKEVRSLVESAIHLGETGPTHLLGKCRLCGKTRFLDLALRDHAVEGSKELQCKYLEVGCAEIADHVQLVAGLAVFPRTHQATATPGTISIWMMI
jgi:hypothetical protein